PLVIYGLSSVFMLPVMMKKSPEWKQKLSSNWGPLGLLGGLGGLSIILQMMAFKLTLVSYVVSIKRLSIPITVLASFFLLKEKEDFKKRLVGAALMALGTLMIYF
ncbi:MAG: hypothetical protein BRC26_02615, partial [Nanohaloarchaea archaeon QH_8_44_6]